MKFLSWNSQGRMKRLKLNYINQLHQNFKFVVLFVVKSKANFAKSNTRINQLPLYNRFIFPLNVLKVDCGYFGKILGCGQSKSHRSLNLGRYNPPC